MPKTFQELFCESYECSTEDYGHQSILRCCHPNSIWFFRLFRSDVWEAYADAMRLMNELGRTKDDDEFKEIIREYQDWIHGRRRILTWRFYIRISTTRASLLHARLRKHRNESSRKSTFEE